MLNVTNYGPRAVLAWRCSCHGIFGGAKSPLSSILVSSGKISLSGHRNVDDRDIPMPKLREDVAFVTTCGGVVQNLYCGPRQFIPTRFFEG